MVWRTGFTETDGFSPVSARVCASYRWNLRQPERRFDHASRAQTRFAGRAKRGRTDFAARFARTSSALCRERLEPRTSGPTPKSCWAPCVGADGLLWATPEYHGSYSGALKNALDLASIQDYEGKVVALMGVAAGQIGAIQALSHLRGIARQLHMWAIPSQLSIARSYAAFDDAGQLKDEKLAASLEKMSAGTGEVEHRPSSNRGVFPRVIIPVQARSTQSN